MDRQPLLYSCFNRRHASAIIGALVLCGVLAMAVGIMLSASNNAIRRSAEKITYEQAYQAALAGTHVARAWLIDPELAESMSGSSNDASALEDIVQKASDMNRDIAKDVAAKLRANQPLTGLNLYGTSRYAAAGLIPSGAKKTADNRTILYTFKASPVVSFTGEEQPKEKLFGSDAPEGNNYVEWVRLTTPGTTPETSASLRECTFIVEAKAVSEVAGQKKERVVHQRILIKPNDPAAPLLSATEAIITDGSFSTQEMSSGNVHWGPVLARGNIENRFFEAITMRTKGNGNKKEFDGWDFNLNQSQKANLAGLYGAESGNNKSAVEGVVDTWLHWRAGTSGKLRAAADKGNSAVDMFGELPNVPTGEFDFFKALMDGDLNTGATPVNLDNFQLDAEFAAAGTSLKNVNQFNGLISYEDGEYTSGALVQGSPQVDQRIDEFFGAMNYDKLKTYAQAHNSYYTYDGSTLRDAAGNVVSLPSMSPGNKDTLADSAAVDRMLFIDSVHGTEDKPFTKEIQLPSFWKGIVYVNGPIGTSGSGGSPTINVRSPKQFKNYRETGSSDKQEASGVFVDGIVICNGTADLGANGMIYGTLAAKGGVITGANFTVLYNAVNGEGRLKDTSKGKQPFALIAGNLYEVAVPNS